MSWVPTFFCLIQFWLKKKSKFSKLSAKQILKTCWHCTPVHAHRNFPWTFETSRVKILMHFVTTFSQEMSHGFASIIQKTKHSQSTDPWEVAVAQSNPRGTRPQQVAGHNCFGGCPSHFSPWISEWPRNDDMFALFWETQPMSWQKSTRGGFPESSFPPWWCLAHSFQQERIVLCKFWWEFILLHLSVQMDLSPPSFCILLLKYYWESPIFFNGCCKERIYLYS